MRFSDQGVPIMTMEEKLAALAYCIRTDAHEDAAGHLCDLLDHCRKNIHPSACDHFENLHQMVDVYGLHPTPINSAEEPHDRA